MKITRTQYHFFVKAWYSFPDNKNYNGKEPAFFPTQDKNWASELKKNSFHIKEELKSLLSSNEDFNPYFSADLNEKKTWKTFVFKWWGINFIREQKKCPKTSHIISTIPGLVSASFSLMEPHSVIPEHCGDTNAIYRAHLGLIVPGQLPECGFTVNGESKSWEEGNLLLFCDAHKHSAKNETDKIRIVLIIDVVREEFIQQRNWISAKVIASLFLQKRVKYFPLLKILPGWFIGIIHFSMAINALWFIPFRNDISLWLHKKAK